MAYHKHNDSSVSDELFFPGVTLEVESTALISPSCLSPSHNGLARSASALSSKSGHGRDNASSSVQAALFTTSTEALIVYKGVRVVIKQSPTSVSWRPSRLSLCGTESAFMKKLLYPEILSARVVSGPRTCAACHACLDLPPEAFDGGHNHDIRVLRVPPFASPFSHQTPPWGVTPTVMDAADHQDEAHTTDCHAHDKWDAPLEHSLVIFSYCRKRGNPNEWRLKSYQLSSNSLELLKDLAAAINAQMHSLPDRPRNILVFINPQSGARAAKRVWSRVVQPVFNNALIKYTLVCTEFMDHAKEYISNMKREELEQYQGLVAIGGDGLFQELVRGIIAQQLGSGSMRIRLGHIPAGSTDAVAYTLHGTRSVITAALHIALGDRLSVDLSRVSCSAGSVRYSMCMAGYGFLGDVMAASETLRWMGPVRYDVAGALRYLRLRSYNVEVQFKPGPSLGDVAEPEELQVCYRDCATCRSAASSSRTQDTSQLASGPDWLDVDGWQTISGQFTSIMCVTSSCRSDKSKSGVVPTGHLADGRLVLVLVRSCDHVQYLRFLVSLTQGGVRPGLFPFVEIHRATAVRFKSLGGQQARSVWNVDGELLENTNVHVQVLRGMVDVFSRGVERSLS